MVSPIQQTIAAALAGMRLGGCLISTTPHCLLLLPSVVPSTGRARPSSLKARMAVTFARCRKTRAGNQHGQQKAGRGDTGYVEV